MDIYYIPAGYKSKGSNHKIETKWGQPSSIVSQVAINVGIKITSEQFRKLVTLI